jgi:hypothetical protein
LLRQQASGLLLAFCEVSERKLCERGSVGGLSHEDFARLGDGLVDLPALTQCGNVKRSSPNGVRMVPNEVGQRVGGRAWLAPPASHFGEAHGNVLGILR